MPTAGQQRDVRAVGVEPQRRARRVRIQVQRNLIGERMADEHGAHAVLVVEALLERQQAQHQIDRAADRPHAPLAPRPDLRADVLHGADPARLQARRDPQVELLGVDADVDVGPLRKHAREQVAANAQQARQMRQDLEQPHHGEIFGALPGLAARGNHARPCDAGEPRAAARERAALRSGVRRDCRPRFRRRRER